MVDGTFEDFMGLSFNEIDLGEMDLTGFSYFILGHVTGSEHLILSADGEGAALDDAFEDMLIDGVRNMDGLDPTLGDPGGAVFVSPEDFESFFGTGVDTFTSGTGDIPFDTVGLVGGETDLLGFSDPVLLGTLTLNGDLTGNTFTPAPEPGLALLAVVGLAGAAISRRRRRAA
jgi:MYXO-CTERM domain-containing protein